MRSYWHRRKAQPNGEQVPDVALDYQSAVIIYGCYPYGLQILEADAVQLNSNPVGKTNKIFKLIFKILFFYTTLEILGAVTFVGHINNRRIA